MRRAVDVLCVGTVVAVMGLSGAGNGLGTLLVTALTGLILDAIHSYTPVLLMVSLLVPVTYDHHANFFNVMRTRKIEQLNTDIEEGHRSAVLIHLANLSYRLGRTINFDPAKEQIVGDPEASRMMTRQYRAPFIVPARV